MKKINQLIQGNISFVTFTFILAFYFTAIVNLPVYKELNNILSQLDNVKVGFIISIPFFFLAALNFLFNLFSWPWIGKPFFITLLIISSMVSYAGYNYGTLFDYDMIVNIVETDSSEATSYLSSYSIVWTILMGVIPALLVLKAPLNPTINLIKLVLTKLASMLASLAVIALIAGLYYQDYASVGRNNSYLKKNDYPYPVCL